MTIDVCPDVCRACGYLTLGPDVCSCGCQAAQARMGGIETIDSEL